MGLGSGQFVFTGAETVRAVKPLGHSLHVRLKVRRLSSSVRFTKVV